MKRFCQRGIDIDTQKCVHPITSSGNEGRGGKTRLELEAMKRWALIITYHSIPSFLAFLITSLSPKNFIPE